MQLDDKDRKILDCLRKDGRMSAVAMAEALEVPRATVQERLARLMEKGVIRRFSAILDYPRLGLGVVAYILVSFRSDSKTSQRELAEKIAGIQGVHEVALIAGEWDIILKVRGPSVEEIGRLVLDRLRKTEGVEKTQTCVSFDVVKEEA